MARRFVTAVAEILLKLKDEYWLGTESLSARGMVNEIVRKYGDTVKLKYSKAAKRLYPNVDLSAPRIRGERWSYPGLFFEHKDPVCIAVDKILHAKTAEEIQAILDSAEICWVTVEENEKLKAAGYNTNRPDSDRAYRDCGIEIE